jgi:maleate isomerase
VAAASRPDAILIWSTNLPGLEAMAPLEAELGIPVIDSAAAGVWGALDALGVDMAPARPFGRLFGG